MQNFYRPIFILAGCFALAACWPEDDTTGDAENKAPRAVKTIVAEERPAIQLRRFPSVLEPPQLVPLSFEVGGRVSEVDLRVGQQVAAGELLATIEPVDLDIQLSQAEAVLQEAKAGADNARSEAARQSQLFERGVTTAVTRDRAVTQAEQADARLVQAQRNVDLLTESREDADLRAPFDAVINSVDIQDFASVKAGEPVVTLYQEGTLQASILVSFDVVRNLQIGDMVEVVPTDIQVAPLQATISEIGRRAPAVSSFPVIVRLENPDTDLRSGMAVEVRLETNSQLPAGLIPLPLTALNLNESGPFEGTPPYSAQVFVFVSGEQGEGTLEARSVSLGAVAEGEIFVMNGLSVGERVVTAGVPFLYDGQKSRLLSNGNEQGD